MGKVLPPLPRPGAPPPVAKPPFSSGGSGADVSYSISGSDEIISTLKKVPKWYVDAAGYEMAEIAHEVIQDAKDHYVPFKFGPLKDSGGADEYKPNGSMKVPEITEIRMWFGAPVAASASLEGKRLSFNEGGLSVQDASAYALEQHENLTFKHNPPPDMTGPKYLERPLLAKFDQIEERLAKAMFAVDIGGNVPDMRRPGTPTAGV